MAQPYEKSFVEKHNYGELTNFFAYISNQYKIYTIIILLD